MKQTILQRNGQIVALLQSDSPIIFSGQDALELAMNLSYAEGCSRIALNRQALSENFFVLSTGLAGDILQKFTNYHIRFAVYGDFSDIKSKALRDFIRESNRGTQVFFADNAEQAVERLAQAV